MTFLAPPRFDFDDLLRPLRFDFDDVLRPLRFDCNDPPAMTLRAKLIIASKLLHPGTLIVVQMHTHLLFALWV